MERHWPRAYSLAMPTPPPALRADPRSSGWVLPLTIILVRVPRNTYALVYDPAIRSHLAAIDPQHHSLIRTTIEEQLAHQPDKETRNRKPLRRPSALGTAWELRFGPNNRFRVFYSVNTAERQVRVLAVGEKHGSVLRIGGEEFEL